MKPHRLTEMSATTTYHIWSTLKGEIITDNITGHYPTFLLKYSEISVNLHDEILMNNFTTALSYSDWNTDFNNDRDIDK